MIKRGSRISSCTIKTFQVDIHVSRDGWSSAPFCLYKRAFMRFVRLELRSRV